MTAFDVAAPRDSAGTLLGADPPTIDRDRDSLEGVASGRLGALEELYERHCVIAYSVALRITGDAAAAEDVVQDAFLAIWRNAHLYSDGRGSVRTWLLAIIHHRSIDVIRQRRPTSELPEDVFVHPPSLIAPDIWEEVSGHLDATRARDALRALPSVQREALELAYFSGLTQAEVAVRTGAPIGTVKGRMRLGLLALRRALEDGERLASTSNGSVE